MKLSIPQGCAINALRKLKSNRERALTNFNIQAADFRDVSGVYSGGSFLADHFLKRIAQLDSEIETQTKLTK